jgi:hypothetical protein
MAPHDHVSLFKEDRPRRIDQYISFFGNEDAADASTDACGEELLEVLSGEHWTQQ